MAFVKTSISMLNSSKQQEEQYKVTEEIIGNPPSRRANATFSPHPTNTNELILFGGEFYDGQKGRGNTNCYLKPSLCAQINEI